MGRFPPGREEDPPFCRGVPRQLPVTQESRLVGWTQLLAQERSRLNHPQLRLGDCFHPDWNCWSDVRPSLHYCTFKSPVLLDSETYENVPIYHYWGLSCPSTCFWSRLVGPTLMHPRASSKSRKSQTLQSQTLSWDLRIWIKRLSTYGLFSSL